MTTASEMECGEAMRLTVLAMVGKAMLDLENGRPLGDTSETLTVGPIVGRTFVIYLSLREKPE